MSKKKKRERFLLQRFIDVSKLDMEILEQREEPDFFVQTDQSIIGVEVTEMFISHRKSAGVLQAQESIADQIVSKAQSLYEVAGGRPADVNVVFGPGQDLRGLNRDETAKVLCEYVLKLNLSPWQVVESGSEYLDGLFPYEVSYVRVLGIPDQNLAHWGVARAGWVSSLDSKLVQERIDAKAKRISVYQKAIAVNWLLIVADAMKPSSLIEIPSDFDSSIIHSPFSRTFFYRYPDEFIELG